MSNNWQKYAKNAFRKIHNASEKRTGTNLTADEVQALMLTGIGEEDISYYRGLAPGMDSNIGDDTYPEDFDNNGGF